MVIRRNSSFNGVLSEEITPVEKPLQRRHSDNSAGRMNSKSSLSSSHSSTLASEYDYDYDYEYDLEYDGYEQDDEKQVLFGCVSVMEFPREVGDNPSVTEGCPLTIGWHVVKQTEYDVDVYELMRPQSLRRRRDELRIPADQRAQILLSHGHSLQEIATSTLEALKIKDSRETRIQNTKMETFCDNIVMTGHKWKKKVVSNSQIRPQRRSFSMASPIPKQKPALSLASPEQAKSPRPSLSIASPPLKSLRSPFSFFSQRKSDSAVPRIPCGIPDLS